MRRLTSFLALLALVLSVSWGAVAAPAAHAAAGAGAYHPVTPARVLDTRVGTGAAQQAVAPGATISVQVTGRAGLPSSVGAVAVNVTVNQPTSSGFLTVYPAGTTRPNVSNLNFRTGQTVANFAIVKTSSDGRLSFTNTSSGSLHVIADVAGYYTAGAATDAGAFGTLTPARVLDTRYGVGSSSSVASGQTLTLTVAGRGGVPTGAGAVAMNITVTNPTSNGFLTAYPAGTTKPTASNLNFSADQSVPNFAVVKLSSDGRVSFTNTSAGSVDVIADVAGYVVAGTPSAPGTYGALRPTRAMDTRNGTPTGTLSPGETVKLAVAGRSGVPTGAGAVALNLTVTEPSSNGFVTAFPGGTTRPNASNVNFLGGQTIPNFAIVKLGADGTIAFTNTSAGTIELIADLAGYFLPADASAGTGGAGSGYDVIVAYGQSNNSGSGSAVSSTDVGGSRIMQYAASGPQLGQIIPAKMPLAYADQSTGVGNQITLAQEWLKHVPADRSVLIVPVAQSGQPIATGVALGKGGVYYERAVDYANKALALAGPGSRIAAITFIQGENEAVSHVSGDEYTRRATEVLTGLRQDISGAQDAPIIIGSMVPEWREYYYGTSREIHEAQKLLTTKLYDTYFVEGPRGMNEGEGGIHYSAPGQRTLGTRLAAAPYGGIVAARPIASNSANTYTIPWSPRVDYYVNGVKTPRGIYSVGAVNKTVTVEARPNVSGGYMIGTSTWTFTFTA